MNPNVEAVTTAGGAEAGHTAGHVAALGTLRRLHEMMDGLNAGLDLDQTMTSVVEGVVAGLGYGVAVISMVQPDQDLMVAAVAGDAEARAALEDSRSARSEWDRMMACGTPVGPSRHLRLVEHTRGDIWNQDALRTWVPSTASVGTVPDGRVPWHPLDALFAPLTSVRAGLLGMLSVDLPPDGLRPTEEQLGLLEVFVAQAATAVEHARLHTELVAADELARTALAARLQAVIDASPAAIVEIDRAGVVQQWSRSAERLLGFLAEDVVGRPFPQLADRHVDLPKAIEWFEAGGDLPVTELAWTRADGVVVELEVSTGPTRDADGAVHGLMGLLVDITERKRLERELHRQATLDSLTQLPNRRLLKTRLGAALTSGAGCTAVLVLDLDRFKDVNDTLGHGYGDRLLIAVGQRLSGLVGPGDTLARIAGDEFAIVLADVTDVDTVASTCRRILRALHRTFDLDGVPVDVEVSIGVATSTRAGQDAEKLLRQADLAMYEAKQNSSGVVSSEPDRVGPQSDRVALLGELRRALTGGELLMHYQPQVDVATGNVYGVEALVRWQHPTRGLLSPGAFLHVAESTGLVKPLTLHVLDEVCAQLATWSRTGQVLPVAVNLSARSLHDRQLGDQVREALDRHHVDASTLRLEVTESAVMSDPQRALAVLNDLVRSDLQLSLDDFGTGFSSMSHLRDLPATELKVDRSFVTDMTRNPHDHVLVRSIIDLAHNLGLLVVAEGVEDAETLVALDELGCDVAQGYHIARPMPIADLDRWLQAQELRLAG